MILQLSRMLPMEGGILGILSWRDRRWWTLEREWKHNRSFVSCVPYGWYELRPHDGAKYQNTYALVGDTVSDDPEPEKPRSSCVFHAANYASELSGCISVGLSVNAFGALQNSQDALDDLLATIATQDPPLRLNIGGARG